MPSGARLMALDPVVVAGRAVATCCFEKVAMQCEPGVLPTLSAVLARSCFEAHRVSQRWEPASGAERADSPKEKISRNLFAQCCHKHALATVVASCVPLFLRPQVRMRKSRLLLYAIGCIALGSVCLAVKISTSMRRLAALRLLSPPCWCKRAKGESARDTMKSAQTVRDASWLNSWLVTYGSFPCFFPKHLSKDSRGKCSALTKRLANYRCENNAARDFYRMIRLPLASWPI
jgi:hypothetical protein